MLHPGPGLGSSSARNLPRSGTPAERALWAVPTRTQVRRGNEKAFYELGYLLSQPHEEKQLQILRQKLGSDRASGDKGLHVRPSNGSQGMSRLYQGREAGVCNGV